MLVDEPDSSGSSAATTVDPSSTFLRLLQHCPPCESVRYVTTFARVFRILSLASMVTHWRCYRLGPCQNKEDVSRLAVFSRVCADFYSFFGSMRMAMTLVVTSFSAFCSTCNQLPTTDKWKADGAGMRNARSDSSQAQVSRDQLECARGRITFSGRSPEEETPGGAFPSHAGDRRSYDALSAMHVRS